MSKLIDALKKKFNSPKEALRALGLDESLLKKGNVLAGDSKPHDLADDADRQRSLNNMGKSILLTRKAAMTMGALVGFLKPRLAADAAIDWAKTGIGQITAKNFGAKKGALITALTAQIKGKLAKDASIEGMVDLLTALENVEGKDAEMATEPSSALPLEAMEDDDESMDADPHEGLKGYLREKGMSEDDIAGACSAVDAALGTEKASEEGEDEKDEDEMKAKDKKGAKDDPPDFKGKPEVGGGMVTKDAMNKAIKATQTANDAAIEKAVKAEQQRQVNLREAERFVRPWIGDLAPMACDSADDVYKTALTAMGKKVDGIHPSAFKALLESIPTPNKRNSDTLASDTAVVAGAREDFSKRFPGAARIRQA